MSDSPDLRRLRPWYFVVSMYLAWVSGVAWAASGCATFRYLRGSQEMIDDARANARSSEVVDAQLEIDFEQARLEALANSHRSAFPLSVARMLLGLALAMLSGAALSGRKGSRTLTAQLAGACLLLTALTFVWQTPIRENALDTVADRALDARGSMPELDGVASRAVYRAQWEFRERGLFGMRLGVFALAIFALTRDPTRRYFAACAAATVSDEDGD